MPGATRGRRRVGSRRVQVSVVIRARDEAASIGRTLGLLAEQRTAHEVIVVDSGSVGDRRNRKRPRSASDRDLRLHLRGRAEHGHRGRAGTGGRVALRPRLPPDRDWLSRVVAWVRRRDGGLRVRNEARTVSGAPLGSGRCARTPRCCAPHRTGAIPTGRARSGASLWVQRAVPGGHAGGPRTASGRCGRWEAHGAGVPARPGAGGRASDHSKDLRARMLSCAEGAGGARVTRCSLDLPRYGVRDLAGSEW